MPQTSTPPSAVVGHGDMFTDHMLSSAWTEARGWRPLELGRLEPIPLHPATIGLHYAQVIFEGLKAPRTADGTVALFRPRENARRFRRSAQRLAMPELPEEMFLAALEELVPADASGLA